MILLNCAASISNSTMFVENLIRLMNISQHRIIKGFKDARVMVNLDVPADVGLGSFDPSMIKGDIYLTIVRRLLDPVIQIEN